jgi:hypothetical protein
MIPEFGEEGNIAGEIVGQAKHGIESLAGIQQLS